MCVCVCDMICWEYQSKRLTTSTTLARTGTRRKGTTTTAATRTSTESSRANILDALAGVTWAVVDGAPGVGIGRTNHRTSSAARSRAGGAQVNGTVIDGRHGALLLGEELLPPDGVAVEQAQLLLGLLVVGHLVLELAALLGEGAGAVVDPLVAVDLVTPVGGGVVGRPVVGDSGAVAFSVTVAIAVAVAVVAVVLVVDHAAGREDDSAGGGGAVVAAGGGRDDGIDAVLLFGRWESVS